MNHCHDCNSDYAKPGTCNCFAEGGKRHAAPAPAVKPIGGGTWVYPYPHTPAIYPSPWWGVQPPPQPYTTITYTPCTEGFTLKGNLTA